MALIGNRSVLLKSPGRYFGGSTVSDNRSNFGTPGSSRGRFVGAFPQSAATLFCTGTACQLPSDILHALTFLSICMQSL